MPLFTVSLNYRKPGFYDFGFIDKQKYSGNIRYYKVPEDLPTPNLWGVTITGVGVGVIASQTPRTPAFIDSGGAFIFLPDSVCSTYYAGAPSAKMANVDVNNNGRATPVHIYPCKDTLPDLTVFIGDSPQQYVVAIPGKLLQGAETGDEGSEFESPKNPEQLVWMNITKAAFRLCFELDGQWNSPRYTSQRCFIRPPVPPHDVRSIQIRCE